ncbi:hypothetical protein KEM48_002156 [Puccinia striiformis f. sp. tritici PST-130]|nr:hypothetical protein KEM48_002156 [Puccinia striiformis f. sp. tritici PST-130]
MSMFASNDSTSLQDVLNSRKDLHTTIACVGDYIHDIVKLYRKSDWAILQEDWLMTVTSYDRSLGDFAYIFHHLSHPTPDLANLTINPVEQIELTVNDTNIQTRGDPSFRAPFMEMTRLTIIFVKLTRIWVKKALKMVPKRPVLERDTQINSETMKRLRNAFDCITGTLIVLSQDHGAVHHRNRAISIALRDSIRISVLSLSQDMRSCLSDLNSHLVPSRPVGNTSIESDYEEWSLSLEQVWNKTVYQLLVLIPSLETDPDQQLEQV